ncbi:putative intracellular protease/amidase [Mariniflexile fucanivorans]|uniref:Putative intracellular protease/amidase n=1 Tax=Mariniflexile fucanivorans TaxID=264023 RepID=A0A4R1RMZ3_9FLAO|nr:type 1 glutamine amidotransferase domain-containing protein [Mariniflexile fucanivorans]TCL67489.1 putative intracellular protease/amidase [Mariniflexile fucanivorans]
MKNILIIVTSHCNLFNTDNKTGLWIGEFTEPYYEFIDAGFKITIASPKGGDPPIDNLSQLTENITASNRRYQDDLQAQQALMNSLRLDAITGFDYDAIFLPGGHGPMFDLASNETCASLILEFIKSKKPIAAVCHGPAALLKAAHLDKKILSGKRITAFSNMEEKLAMRSDNIPYYLEDKLKELGADYCSSPIPFIPHVERDGLLITGQNPLSAGPTAKALIKVLQKN